MEATHILEGNVIALYGDYSQKNSPKAVLEIQFFLIDNTSTSSEMIFQNNYRREVALNSSLPEALVKGWNEALQQILTDLEEDLREVDLKAGR